MQYSSPQTTCLFDNTSKHDVAANYDYSTDQIRPPNPALFQIFQLKCIRETILEYGDLIEGNPSKRELGESSASLPKILPVSGEPIHHTIPLLATRIARHEDRLNDIVNVINGLPCGHITEDVNNLIIGQMVVESKVEQIKTEFSESMEFIAALCSANIAMGDVLTSFDLDLEQISAQNFSLRRAIQESYARERTRD
ncbi:hypothetical protein CTI12_AA518440 [Artemisia annua]|uniref:Uncharacterized protein n=1 Tax=Artemisia annua TaxID=35608 RepID=A0A2U1L936_ARTAN|nr:hypothetical protein CTI12_AA518440 [Artemisia annua]